jgi:hypothetical protein
MTIDNDMDIVRLSSGVAIGRTVALEIAIAAFVDLLTSDDSNITAVECLRLARIACPWMDIPEARQ